MPIERWNPTTSRYEAVTPTRYGNTIYPTASWVYAGGKWRRVWNKPAGPTPVGATTTGPLSVTRNTWMTQRTYNIAAAGPMRLAVSWVWAAATASTHTRSVQILVNGVVITDWFLNAANVGWTDSGSADLALSPGDVVIVRVWATSATTAARMLTSLTTTFSSLQVKNPRGDARLWVPFHSSGSFHAGIERPSTVLLGSPQFVNDTIRFPVGTSSISWATQTIAGLPTGFTYSFWMRTLSNATGWRTILHHAPNVSPFNPESYVVYNMTSSTAGTIVTGLRLGSKVSEFASSSTYPRNTWMHVAVVWSRPTTTSWTRELYVDGKLRNTDTGTGFPTTPSIEGQPIELGSADWNGDMDDFGYFDRPLTALEVQSIYLQKDPGDLPAT